MELNKAQDLALNLMSKYGLLEEKFEFKFDNALTRFGQCEINTRKGIKKISLSKTLTILNEESEIRNTILHEIAHALVGIKEGHGKKWIKIAKSLGCDGEIYLNEKVTKLPKGKYTYMCPNCKKQYYRHKKISLEHMLACKNCCNNYNDGKFTTRFLWVDMN